MSFTVSRRTREIGIRTALGADPRRIVRDIFSRALGRVAVGILAGGIIMLLTMGGFRSARGALLVLAPTTLMFAVCLLACLVPTRRALRIQPTDALRAGD